MQTSLLITVSLDQLSQLIREGVKDELNAFKGQLTPEPDTPEYLSRKETAEFLRVTTVTIDEWVKRGLIKGYHFGSRVRFKSLEIRAFAETPASRRYSTKH